MVVAKQPLITVVLRTEGEGENEAMDAMLKLLKEYEK